MLKHPNAFKTLLLAPSHTPQVPSPYPQVLFALGYYRYIKNANFASLYIGTHEMKVSPILSQTIIAATKTNTGTKTKLLNLWFILFRGFKAFICRICIAKDHHQSSKSEYTWVMRAFKP